MLSPRRFLPRVSYTNFLKLHPHLLPAPGVFTQWFRVQRFWYGRLITVSVKHYQVTFDFRGSWLYDMEHAKGRGNR